MVYQFTSYDIAVCHLIEVCGTLTVYRPPGENHLLADYNCACYIFLIKCYFAHIGDTFQLMLKKSAI